MAGPVQAFVPLEGLIDLDAERARIKKAMAVHEGDLEGFERKLANPNFRDRAPADIVAKEEAKALEARQHIDKLLAQLAELGE